MIEYLGVEMCPIEKDGQEVVQFKMVFLNTTKNGLFAIKKPVSHWALDNPEFMAGEYVAACAESALRKYCKMRYEEITPEQRDAMYKVIVDRVDQCAKAWREGKQVCNIKEIDYDSKRSLQ
jgi:hypothetical protein